MLSAVLLFHLFCCCLLFGTGFVAALAVDIAVVIAVAIAVAIIAVAVCYCCCNSIAAVMFKTAVRSGSICVWMVD